MSREENLPEEQELIFIMGKGYRGQQGESYGKEAGRELGLGPYTWVGFHPLLACWSQIICIKLN